MFKSLEGLHFKAPHLVHVPLDIVGVAVVQCYRIWLGIKELGVQTIDKEYTDRALFKREVENKFQLFYRRLTNNTMYGCTKTVATTAEFFSTIFMLWCSVSILDVYGPNPVVTRF